MWNPEVYLKFAHERGRPFHELVARVAAHDPRLVVDLGCGPGNLTETLTRRWPGATIQGIDSSPEMIAQTNTSGGSVGYRIGDITDYLPDPQVDVIVTNAVLQWVSGHEELLERWVAPGRWIAMQVPANFDNPAHVLLCELADEFGVDPVLRRPVRHAVHYARVLRAAGCEVDAWETNYIHQLPVPEPGPHPVLTWMTGTALRPVRAALSDADWESFTARFEAGLWDRYPPEKGFVYFPFLRVFAVAYRST